MSLKELSAYYGGKYNMKNKKQKLIILISIIIIVVIIGIIMMPNVIKIVNRIYNSANNNSSGSNLIPEYIKEGITLGGVTGTLIDLDTSDATAKPEDVLWGKTAYVNGQKITGTKVVPKIGDYVNYTPDAAGVYTLASTISGYTSNQSIVQDTSLKWQILSINVDNSINLISSKQTNNEVHLSSALGYNNGVYLLNDICSKQYSNNSLGALGRSIKIEDIESKMNSEGIAIRNEYNRDGVVYGNPVTIYRILDYPCLYARENGSGIDTTVVKKDGIGWSDSYYTSPTFEETNQTSNSLTITQTFYDFTGENNYFNDEAFNNLIFGDEQNYYWVATRYSDYVIASGNQSSYSNFGIRCIKSNTLNGGHMFPRGSI